MVTKEVSRGKFPSLLILLQGILLIIFVVFVELEPNVLSDSRTNDFDSKYTVFENVHCLIVVGFGLLLTFLKKYGFSAMGYVFLIAGVSMQWAALMEGFLNMKNEKIQLGMDSLIAGDLATLTVVISFGAILGKTSNLQLIVVAFFEVVYYIVNKDICTRYLQAVDHGGGMFIHLFGACFGLMVARVLYKQTAVAHENETSRYTSDLFAVIGTLIIWVYWPSLNIVHLDNSLKYRAVLNTYFAMAASCVTVFGFSSLLGKGSKLSMVYIQNATLSGGVAIASIAAIIVQPWGSILIGMVAGFVSTIGYKYFQKFLIKKLYVHDTSGIGSLHGLPGILAGISSAISSALASYDKYKASLYVIYPARAPELNSTQYFELAENILELSDGLGRTAGTQAGYQLAALAATMATAILGGLITGFIVKSSFLSPLTDNSLLYTDTPFWEVPEDFYGMRAISVLQSPVRDSDRQASELMAEIKEDSLSTTATLNNFHNTYSDEH